MKEQNMKKLGCEILDKYNATWARDMLSIIEAKALTYSKEYYKWHLPEQRRTKR